MKQLSYKSPHIIPVMIASTPPRNMFVSWAPVVRAYLPSPSCLVVSIHQPDKTIDTINSSVFSPLGMLWTFWIFWDVWRKCIPPCFCIFPFSALWKWPGFLGETVSNGKPWVFGTQKKGQVAKIFDFDSPDRESITGWCRVTRPESLGRILINNPSWEMLFNASLTRVLKEYQTSEPT